GQILALRPAGQGHGRVPATAWWLWLHERISDRAHVARRPRAAHLWRHQRDHEASDRKEPVRNSMSTYVAEIEWKANPEEDFRRGRYSRVHEIRFDNGLAVRASASPSVVPQPFADPTAVDPEE